VGRSAVALILVVAFLVACGGTQVPAPTASLAAPATGPAPAPTGATALRQATPALPTPPRPTTVLQPAAVQAPLPAHLRTLEFGIPAGNSYYPQAMAVDAGLGRLYARTRGLSWGTAGMVAAVDSVTGQVTRVVEAGADEYSSGDLAVDAVHSRLYVVNAWARTASVLDAASLEPVTVLLDVQQLALDTEGGRPCVAGADTLRVLGVLSYAPL
jgi:hypothetical protein